MTFMTDIGPCISCARIFCFNPERLPSSSATTGQRESVCSDCMVAAINRTHRKAGHEPRMMSGYELMRPWRRIGFIDWLCRRSDRNRATTETSTFLARIKEVDGMPLALTMVQAEDVASRLYADTNGKIDLLRPHAALASRPTLIWELTEAVIQLQAAGRQTEAPGTIMWVATLRAEMFPSIRPLVKELWSLVMSGGFHFAPEVASLSRLPPAAYAAH